jgi:threonine aldolase
MGARLARAVGESASARLALEPAANEIFAVISKTSDVRLKAAGAVYHPWPADSVPPDGRPRPDEVLVRLVTSWQTSPDDVDRFAKVLNAA